MPYADPYPKKPSKMPDPIPLNVCLLGGCPHSPFFEWVTLSVLLQVSREGLLRALIWACKFPSPRWPGQDCSCMTVLFSSLPENILSLLLESSQNILSLHQVFWGIPRSWDGRDLVPARNVLTGPNLVSGQGDKENSRAMLQWQCCKIGCLVSRLTQGGCNKQLIP